MTHPKATRLDFLRIALTSARLATTPDLSTWQRRFLMTAAKRALGRALWPLWVVGLVVLGGCDDEARQRAQFRNVRGWCADAFCPAPLVPMGIRGLYPDFYICVCAAAPKGGAK